MRWILIIPLQLRCFVHSCAVNTLLGLRVHSDKMRFLKPRKDIWLLANRGKCLSSGGVMWSAGFERAWGVVEGGQKGCMKDGALGT